MELSVVFAALWVISATIVALLPMRMQFPPGVVLLICAPVLVIWLGRDFGLIIATLAIAAFVSMFRKPLRFYWCKWIAREVAE